MTGNGKIFTEWNCNPLTTHINKQSA